MYAVVRALRHCHHHLYHINFVLKSYHEALHVLNSKTKVIAQQAKWFLFLQGYIFTLTHQVRKENKVVDALIRRSHLLITVHSQVLNFDGLKDIYPFDQVFCSIFQQCVSNQGVHEAYIQHDGFKGSQLRILDCYLRGNLFRNFIQVVVLVIEGLQVHL